jgi:hypothetical protein
LTQVCTNTVTALTTKVILEPLLQASQAETTALILDPFHILSTSLDVPRAQLRQPVVHLLMSDLVSQNDIVIVTGFLQRDPAAKHLHAKELSGTENAFLPLW